MKTTAARPQPTFASLEQRIANQERRINEGLRSGKLTAEEAAPLQERVAAARTGLEADKFDGNGLTQGKAAATLLNGLSKDIHSAKHNDVMDVAKGIDNLGKGITAGKNAGTISEAEAAKFGEQVTALKGELAAATTPEAKKAVQDKFKALAKEVRQERRDGDFDATNRIASFKDRIAKGVADGSLSPKEAERMSGQVAGLEALAAAGIKDARLFNKVDGNIFRQRHDAQVDVAKRSASIGTQLDNAATAGKLTPEQVATFKGELEKLSAEGVQAAGPRLNELQQRIAAALLAAPQPVPMTQVPMTQAA